MALENVLLPHAPSRRWVVSFLFGLVHGFGFASNLGVEAGQALVVALLLPPLIWIHDWRWEPRIVRAASLAVAVVGLAWLVERLFFE